MLSLLQIFTLLENCFSNYPTFQSCFSNYHLNIYTYQKFIIVRLKMLRSILRPRPTLGLDGKTSYFLFSVGLRQIFLSLTAFSLFFFTIESKFMLSSLGKVWTKWMDYLMNCWLRYYRLFWQKLQYPLAFFLSDESFFGCGCLNLSTMIPMTLLVYTIQILHALGLEILWTRICHYIELPSYKACASIFVFDHFSLKISNYGLELQLLVACVS